MRERERKIKLNSDSTHNLIVQLINNLIQNNNTQNFYIVCEFIFQIFSFSVPTNFVMPIDFYKSDLKIFIKTN